MTKVASVRLRRCCRVYDFAVDGLDLSTGDWVIVETSRGKDMGQLVEPLREIPEGDLPHNIKPVLRRANASDFRRRERYRRREGEVIEKAQRIVDEMDLPMRLVSAEYNYTGRSLRIYFTAEKRVDFRQLVKKLARTFRTRVDLRQIGARDEASLVGGIGPCGRLLCCTTFLGGFQRISVRMAKEQDLPLSPMKISGLCGRLLCCLSYEYEQYKEIKALLPEKGEEVTTLQGRGKVVSVNIPKESVTVELRPNVNVEATAEELAQAAQLAQEGRMPSGSTSFVPLSASLERITEGVGESGAQKSEGRRRRDRSSQSGKQSQKQDAKKKKKRGRRRRSRSKGKKEEQQDSSSRKKRRRRRRSRPSSDGGGS